MINCVFSALKLLVGQQEEQPANKNTTLSPKVFSGRPLKVPGLHMATMEKGAGQTKGKR